MELSTSQTFFYCFLVSCNQPMTESILPYRLERTRNRHSRAVLKNDEIIIRLARGLHGAEEKRHIELLLEKMTQAKVREAKRQIINPFHDVLQGANEARIIPIIGKPLHLKIEEGSTLSAKEMNGYWRIRRTSHEPKRFHRLLWRVASAHTEEYIDALVRDINDHTFQSRIREVTIKFMRSRWGSCSMGGVIALSTPLLFTDAEILRYVIIHELAHTHHPNHSAAFWNAVLKHDPEYEEAFKRLKTFRLPQI